MYNSYAFKKKCCLLLEQKAEEKKEKKWLMNYHDKVRPALVEKYSRRVNNFITRLEDDKKQLYEYREQSQSKAHQLLKEIYRKQQFLGDPTIKIRDTQDWNSLLSTAERIQKERNKKLFAQKYGDSDLAFRSIASQSVYVGKTGEFRSRQKQKQIHGCNMKFTRLSRSFGANKKERAKRASMSLTKPIGEEKNQIFIRRASSNNAMAANEDENKSHAYSVMSFSGNDLKNSIIHDEAEASSLNKEKLVNPLRQTTSSSKVYFKRIIDIEQTTNENSVKKSLHQILVRFGMSRLKDVKKQAMAQTDNLNQDQL